MIETTQQKIRNWKNSIGLKILIIGILMFLLLIPAGMVKGIISERESLNRKTKIEVTSKWANAQTVNGPILTIPLIYELKSEDENGKEQATTSMKYLNILPDQLDINGKVSPETLKRGIYEIIVYDSELEISGNFSIHEAVDQANLKKINWDKAFLTFGFSDLRGIQKISDFKWEDAPLTAKPGVINSLVNRGITSYLPDLEPNKGKKVEFTLKIELIGSENLSFVPLGSDTRVKLTSDWTAPSFNGNFLPRHRDVSETGFTATWNVLELNRNLPKNWIGVDSPYGFNDAAFGVDLILPLDDYKKSMRTAKYAAMTIGLTFLIFFLVEVLNKRKIHPFQYILVGFSLCLFYILLVSLSEHMIFNMAYFTSSIVVISMIGAYSISVFRNQKFTTILMIILTSIYGFLFVTLQAIDYALLLGSIGLVIILSLTMYFTRNINWYKIQTVTE